MKKLAPRSEYRQIQANINLTGDGKYITFAIIAGSDRPDPFVNQGLGCTLKANG
jgi:hypothetical protein